jgi:hypothetical protein
MLMLCVAVGLNNGCTVRPRIVKDKTPSFSGGSQTGGWLGFYTNAQGEAFSVINHDAKLRYDALARIYGTNYLVPVIPGAGCSPFTNGTWLIDFEHDVKAREMNWWRKQGR